MKKRWTDTLTNDVYNRLCNCRSTQNDILPLAQARWNYIKENIKLKKEDALVYVMELLDSNGCEYDLTTEMYEYILSSLI